MLRRDLEGSQCKPIVVDDPVSRGRRSREQASRIHIDLTDFDEANDPVLERELAEIALSGRTGTFSTQASDHARDVEDGKEIMYSRDAADSPSWRNPAYNKKKEQVPKWRTANESMRSSLYYKVARSDRLKLYLLIALVVLIAIICGIVFGYLVLSNRQKAIDGILSEGTDTKLLKKGDSPQGQARDWLLFDDKEKYAITRERVLQRYALATFYFGTGGENSWISSNWLSGDECARGQEWHGLGCNQHGEVRTLFRDNRGLSGELPDELGLLSALENLIIKNEAQLAGRIPETLADLRELTQLGLYKNSLTGRIPNLFESIGNLRFLNLEGNHLEGSIPSSIERMTNLETIVLTGNKLEGLVPVVSLANTKVKFLDLGHNHFSGNLDDIVTSLSAVEHLHLDHNKITGSIPATINSMTRLKSLSLGGNGLTGSIPTTLGDLGLIEHLALQNNLLSSGLPNELGRLTNAVGLNLSRNNFSGSIPNIANMDNLVSLELQNNELTGAIPESVQQLQSIEILFLSSNNFVGTIPTGFNRLQRTLKGLYLSDNGLDGAIPSQLCELSSLEALFIDSNQLTGTIPVCLGEVKDLKQLYLFQNSLNGSVPSSLQDLRYLIGLGLEDNDLTGSMPNEVCDLASTIGIDIWADCDEISCACCNVCCPSGDCV
ncbi:unnamed protein product [Cylindrotheca closterium]|uniref:Leucine-rich repeat-containing N-terminal plant-type domain-containing protein n=1 Tax=Cylindrotheca closterium TaxID=2856 RepID=A0AAD2CIS7_9STRA|nr:unnamed protein product [Cylindrotheca closterium]